MTISIEDRARVGEAIRAAEQKTSGEIVCVLARSSSDYATMPLAWSILLALALPWALMWLTQLSVARILLAHALKNAILPTLTLMGVQFGFLFGGSLLVEVIYAYPGMGNLMVDAVRNADLPIIQAVALTYCVVVLAITSAVDALVLLLNPRLRA